MAVPLQADQLIAVLRNEGVRVLETSGWRTNNRNAQGVWGPVNGVVVHHTVTRGTQSTVDLCFRGYSGLPGPLCHGVIAKDGTVYLVGDGRANHAGSGDGSVKQAVITESYNDRPPAPTASNTDGNACFYGFECENMGDGADPWPPEQLEAIERAAAALCRRHGWGAKSVIGHKEWTNAKSDPTFSMPDMRRRIAARLTNAPAPGPGTPPAHQPFPGTDWFHTSPHSPIITAMGHRLVAESCATYAQGPGPQWGEADRQSYAAWQRKCGYTGPDADGWPGPDTWSRLSVPYTTPRDPDD
ncbi:peptidoglycan-binding protein [Streptomyces sp. x-19]|uniref:peptidoglycan-binding protein n=1 Tax=Streptomyces sp. x-19 TaxID=2789280 RepID=UPI0039807379